MRGWRVRVNRSSFSLVVDGKGCVARCNWHKKTARFVAVKTKQEHRRNGYARLLLTSIIDKHRTRVHNLGVWADNPALLLYKELGFIVIRSDPHRRHEENFEGLPAGSYEWLAMERPITTTDWFKLMKTGDDE